MQSCQKPRVEKNHTLFRDIVPKGESFDCLTQDMVNLIFRMSTASSEKASTVRLLMECSVFHLEEGWLLFWALNLFPQKNLSNL
jgi:hypothetical protein